MSDALRGIVVTHGNLAAALVDAVREITGQNGVLLPVSNAGCSRETLRERLAAAVGSEPALVFVDLPAGSCLHAAVSELRERPNVRIVAGVNLPMLLDFVYHRDLTPEAAAQRAAAAGGRAIKAIPT